MFAIAAHVALHSRRKAPVLYGNDLAQPQRGKRSISPSEAAVTCRNTSERTDKQLQLLYEESLLDALMENIPDCIYFKDAVCRYTRINKAQAEVREAGLRHCF